MERRDDAPVSRLMTPVSLSVSTEDSLDRVAAELERHRLFVIPVVNDDRSLFGVISSFGLSHVIAVQKNPKALRAWELCAYRPVTVKADSSALDVAKLMVEKHLHYVVVIDGVNPVGIVSSFDFVRHYVYNGQAGA